MVDKPNFEPVPYWSQMPHGISFANDATSVAVDSQDNVYVFNRGPDPIIIFDKNGNFQDKWGKGEFVRPHGIYIDFEDNLYLVDDDGHFIDKRTKEGKLIFRLGEINKPAPWQSGGMFNRPTDAVVNSKTGDIFISDGYGNKRVHKFDPNGELIKSWGTFGDKESQFAIVHNLEFDSNDRLFVCDRENNRIQIFDDEGNYLEEWNDLLMPGDLWIKDDIVYVCEQTEAGGVSIWTIDGDLITRWNGDRGPGKGTVISGHGICVDSEGSIYVAELAPAARVQKFQKI